MKLPDVVHSVGGHRNTNRLMTFDPGWPHFLSDSDIRGGNVPVHCICMHTRFRCNISSSTWFQPADIYLPLTRLFLVSVYPLCPVSGQLSRRRNPNPNPNLVSCRRFSWCRNESRMLKGQNKQPLWFLQMQSNNSMASNEGSQTCKKLASAESQLCITKTKISG